MNTLDLVVNVVLFVYEALLSYANTEEGQRHLAKIEADLGMVAPSATQPVRSSVATESNRSEPTGEPVFRRVE